MYTEYDAKLRLYGYGQTQEEALQELKFYILREDINRDEACVKRRESMKSWCPTDNCIQFTGIAAIVYKDGNLINTKTGRSVKLKDEPLSQFITLYYLLDKEITFEDFCITYADTIDEFFSNISPNSGRLRDFPVCKPGSFLNDVKAMHAIDKILAVAELKSSSSIVITDYRKMIELPIPIGVPMKNILAYALAKLGLLFDGEHIL